MKTMNSLFFGGLVIILLFVAVTFITRALGSTSEYKFLFRKIYSEERDVYPGRKFLYQLTPLIQGEIYKPNYFYLPERDQYLVRSSLDFPSEMDTETGWMDRPDSTTRHLLLNNKGEVLSSFDTLINFSRFSGIFFAPHFYIDWLESGSTKPKAYKQIVNKDLNLSEAEFAKAFRELHAQAEYMEYISLRAFRDDDHEAGILFKIKGEWTILLAGLKQHLMFQEYNDENPKTGIWDRNYRVRFDHYDKGPQDYPPSPALMQLVPLETDLEDPYIFRNGSGAGDIKVDRFEKDYSENFNESGTAYVRLTFKKRSTFKFKLPDVYKVSFRPIYNLGVRIFRLPASYGDNTLEFLEITQNVSTGDKREGLGVYTLVERQGANFSTPNDLPDGITEKRFNQLPINLQKALINRETTYSLAIDNLDQWLPEIELLENLRYLKFQTKYGKIKQFPEGITQLKNLQVLDLSMNKVQKLPSSFSQLKNLRYVNLSFTELDTFPEELLSLPDLRKLNLGHNPFTEIPDDINRLTQLVELDLSGVEINSLPDSMADMKQLTITTGQYGEFKEKFPEKFQHLFVNKLPSYYDTLEAKKKSATDLQAAPE